MMSSSDTKQQELPPMDTKPMKASMIRFTSPLGIARLLVNLFSDNTGVRDPPTPSKTEHVRLITISVSHYCEKVRWVLDMLEEDPKSSIYYTEDAHPPAFAAFETIPASNDTASATPMIVFDDKRVLVKSDAIVKELCPFLYPQDIADQVAEVEHDLGVRLGSPLRCFAYHYLLQPDYYETAAQVIGMNCSEVEKTLFAAMLDKGIDKRMRQGLKLNDQTAASSKESLLQVFQDYSEKLKQGDYLLDTADKKYGFTAADLTLAALSYPLLRPPCMTPNFSIGEDRLPPQLVELANELRETAAGQHVLKMYEKHRPVSDDGLVYMKSCRRDRKPWKELLYVAGIVGTISVAIMMACRRKN